MGIISPIDLILPTSPLPRLRSVASRAGVLDSYMQTFNVAVTDLAGQLSSGAIGVDDWLVVMRREVKDIHVNAVVISRGGVSRAVTQAEWGRLGGHLRVQYRYLDNYARDVQMRAMNALSGGRPLTQNYIEWRSKLYGRNSRASFYRGLAYGLLPQVPGDGQTVCLVGCQCVLRFEEGENQGELFVYWELRPAEHCVDCVRLAEEWNPYVLMLPVGLSAGDWVAWLPEMEAEFVALVH